MPGPSILYRITNNIHLHLSKYTFLLTLILYNIFCFLYAAGAKLASLWAPKAKAWVKGRDNWEVTIKQKLGSPSVAHKLVWMHCASLGEFEQGRPLLEAIRSGYPQHKIVVTFFSPSGYEIRKNYTGADLVMYLPMDGPATAARFIDAIQPSLVLWVKYEYWYYYLLQLKQRQIPLLLVSGIFRPAQPFFKWYGAMWKKILSAFDHFFVQTDRSVALLQQIGISSNVSIAGDTRFDRVTSIANNWESLAEPLEQFCQDHPVLVAGSTWEEDEADLIHFARANANKRFIIAPHEISKERIADLQEEFPEACLYSELTNRQLCKVPHSNVLIIDNIGMLSRLYKYATVTYVGGGFNQSGIHNILEAAVYGKPVVFGPVYEKFAEARDLVAAGAAFPISNALELEERLSKLFSDEDLLENSSRIAREYVYGKQGATAMIMDHIQRKRLLIN